jgi:hypothetical protein
VLNISADFWQGEGKKKLGEENLSGCEDFFRMADFPGMLCIKYQDCVILP